MSSYAPNDLKKWSCTQNDLPSVQDIGCIHVYDFDNTLFSSPLPNGQLWSPADLGRLQNNDVFVNGGWWHDPGVLSMTGEGIEKEEPRAWKGWWNEQIVNLVLLSMEQKDSLNVLLTGRSKNNFANLIQRIVKSKQLQFDLIALKPDVGPLNQRFSTTMQFKQAFLDDLMHTYSNADEIRIYEDRPKHSIAFREFLASFNQKLASSLDPSNQPFYSTATPKIHRSKPLTFEVIDVADFHTKLDPVLETAQIQRMINRHNAIVLDGAAPSNRRKLFSIKRNVFFTAYLLSPTDTTRLLTIANLPQQPTRDPKTSEDIRVLANSILITPRPAPPGILAKVHGLGASLRWRAIALGNYNDSVWAAKVEPIPSSAQFYTESATPHVTLAVRGRYGRPNDAIRIKSWTPLKREDIFEFDTVVGEKVLLRLDEANAPHSLARNHTDGFKRPPKRPLEEEFPALPAPSKTASGATLLPPAQPLGAQQTPLQGTENRRLLGVNNSTPRSGAGFATAAAGAAGAARGRVGGGVSGGRGGGQNMRGARSGLGHGTSAFQARKGKGAYKSLDDAGTRRGPGGFGSDGTMDGDGGLTY